MITLSMAIFQDQAGKLDWHRENIGRVELAAFNGQKGARQNRVFVGTASNVVAALTLRSGATVWRQVLDPEEKISQILHAGSVVVSVSSSEQTVRAWSVEDGALVWNSQLAPG